MAYYNLAFTKQEQGDLNTAVKNYQKAIAINPEYAEAYCNLANVLKEQENLDKAVV
ncbi:MAG: tetratricopeptide repeat protein [Magnetococcales bacterium]|nr:tetratricopeptide repeat protein [Magnetococcales bacterium]